MFLVEESVIHRPSLELNPRLKRGKTGVVTQAGLPKFRAADRVEPVSGGGGPARVIYPESERATALSRYPTWRPASGDRLR